MTLLAADIFNVFVHLGYILRCMGTLPCFQQFSRVTTLLPTYLLPVQLLTLLHSEWPTLYTILAFLSAIWLKEIIRSHRCKFFLEKVDSFLGGFCLPFGEKGGKKLKQAELYTLKEFPYVLIRFWVLRTESRYNITNERTH